MLTSLALWVAVIIDRIFGEPSGYHPLAGFGWLAQRLESRLYGHTITRGLVGVVLLIGPFALLAVWLQSWPYAVVVNTLLLYLAIGWNSLDRHAANVRDALLAGDHPGGRQQVGWLVSRDTTSLDETAMAEATVESVLENGNDAVFGAIFWFVVAGLPGLVVYRLANTLDAMWGYRNDRYEYFGRAAARLDDVLNFVPARLTAISYALVGHARLALRCWLAQGRTWKSVNAGSVMAAGAGSLNITLGGPASYHGLAQSRPRLGDGPRPGATDIARAQRLVGRALWLWLLVILIGDWCVG